jgi:hypothetical protein
MTVSLNQFHTSSIANTTAVGTDVGVRQRTRVVRPPAASQADASGANSRALRLFIEYVPTAELRPYPKGLRKHDD